MVDVIDWTEERKAALQSYCDERQFSFNEISDKMSARFGVLFSRNACIGKAGRMGIVNDRSGPHCRPHLQIPKIKVKSERKPRLLKTGNNHFTRAKVEIVEWKLRAVEIEPRNLSFSELEANDCRYPYGDKVFAFCGHPKREGSSYCTHHFHLTMQESRPRRLAA